MHLFVFMYVGNEKECRVRQTEVDGIEDSSDEDVDNPPPSKCLKKVCTNPPKHCECLCPSTKGNGKKGKKNTKKEKITVRCQ